MILHLNTDKLIALKHMPSATKFKNSKLQVNGKSIDLHASSKDPKSSTNDLKTSSKENSKPSTAKDIMALMNVQDEEEDDSHYQKILQKVKAGEDLSPQELATIRKNDPELYYKLMLEIQMQKNLEQQLKHAKSKAEAQQAYTTQATAAAKVCGMNPNATVPKDAERYSRLMKRLDKSYQKYLKGELGNNKSESTSSLDAKATFLNTIKTREESDALEDHLIAFYDQDQKDDETLYYYEKRTYDTKG